MSAVVGLTVQAVARSETTARIAVAGELDVATAPALRVYLTACLAAGCTAIVLDVHELTFIDARGLSVLAEVVDLLRRRGGQLTLDKPRPMVRKVLDITGLAPVVLVSDRESRTGGYCVSSPTATGNPPFPP